MNTFIQVIILKIPYFYLIKQLSTLIKIQRKNTKVVKAN